MLLEVRKDQQKIAMGLLSYLPELPNIAAFQREIDWYDASDNRKMLLWQDENTHHYTVFIGVELAFSSVVVERVVFSPEVSELELAKTGTKVLNALQARFQDLTIVGTVATQGILTEWRTVTNG
jgi:riboflavin biosynthesis RibT protein